eukprot:2935329-Pleurochrysis_carterae.AAC.1
MKRGFRERALKGKFFEAEKETDSPTFSRRARRCIAVLSRRHACSSERLQRAPVHLCAGTRANA